jgi:hypothetical protein
MQATGWACWSSYNKHVGSVMFMWSILCVLFELYLHISGASCMAS